MSPSPPGSRAAVLAARLLAAAACGATLLALALPWVTGGGWLMALFRTPEPVVAPSFAVVGAVLAGVPAARRLGWLMLGIGVTAAVYVLAVSWARAGGDAGVAGWLRSWSWVPPLLLFSTVLPQVLPHGSPLPGRWRLPVAAGLVLTVGATVVAALPLGTGGPFGVPGFAPALAALVGCSLASLAVRVRRADAVERRQLAWVAYGAVIALAATFLAPWWGVSLAVLLVPAGLAVAALRYRLYDIDVLVNRTLVGAVLFGLTAVVYAAVVAWAGALLGGRGGAAPFVAAFTVALAFQPARSRVQRAVDRLLHGERGDPYALLTRLDATLRQAASPRQALHDGAEVVAAGLRLRGAAVEVPVHDGTVVREQVGDVTEDAARLPLVLHGASVGHLVTAARAGTGGPASADRKLLGDLAGRLAAAAYAERLSGDLADSRERLVAAREEERRRLRRDLHDGLGPQLSAVVMTLDTASSALLRHDADRARALVAAAGAQAADAVVDVRRLVQGLRPPALDDLGLVAALRAGLTGLASGGPVVSVVAEGDVAGLSAAVEVAVFRIAHEAVHNAVRHSGAGQVEVCIRVRDEQVEVDVVDDGSGIPSGATPGVGTLSMRERAAELGGHCEVLSAGRGTRVHAVLPRQPRS